MANLSFFKRQAKNLLKDYQSRSYNESRGTYEYQPTHYDIGDIFFHYEYPDDDEKFSFTLMNAQHLIAKMVGFKKWDDLIHASPIELELAEILLRKFKNAQDIQEWEETLNFSGIAKYGTEAVLDYALQYYELEARSKIVNLPIGNITIQKGKKRKEALTEFDDEHNPLGTLRIDSLVQCSCCYDVFPFSRSKVINSNEPNHSMVVCKNYPNCKGTYLDYNVLSPTQILGEHKKQILEKEGNIIYRPLKLVSKVRCLHCGDVYNYEDAKIVITPGHNAPHVCCKNFPECNGTIMDFINEDQK